MIDNNKSDISENLPVIIMKDLRRSYIITRPWLTISHKIVLNYFLYNISRVMGYLVTFYELRKLFILLCLSLFLLSKETKINGTFI